MQHQRRRGPFHKADGLLSTWYTLSKMLGDKRQHAPFGVPVPIRTTGLVRTHASNPWWVAACMDHVNKQISPFRPMLDDWISRAITTILLAAMSFSRCIFFCERFDMEGKKGGCIHGYWN